MAGDQDEGGRAIVERMVDEVPEAVYALSSDGIVLRWNRGAENLFGYPRAEAAGRPLAELIVPDDLRDEAAQMLASARAGRRTAFRTIRVRKDGSRVPVDVSLRGVQDGGAAARTFVVREKDIEALVGAQSGEAHFRGLLEAAPDAMVIVDENGRIALVNEQLVRLFGYAREELVGEPIEVLVPDRFRPLHAEHRRRYVGGPRRRPMGAGLDLHGRRKDGSEFPVEISLSPMTTEHGLLVTAAIRDTTDRRRVETELRTSLHEKELLLKEIHHRVKNNLQIVSSMLHLQLDRIGDADAVERFRESQTRVRSIALFHEKLYQSHDIARVDMGDYLRGLVSGLVATYGLDPADVALVTEVEAVPLGVDEAIACGLIVNELVSNSLKHAFPEGRPGHIRIELRERDSQGELIVADDGVGMPESVDFRHPPSLGLQLVCIFSEQMGGTIELDRREGTRFVIRFPRQP